MPVSFDEFLPDAKAGGDAGGGLSFGNVKPAKGVSFDEFLPQEQKPQSWWDRLTGPEPLGPAVHGSERDMGNALIHGATTLGHMAVTGGINAVTGLGDMFAQAGHDLTPFALATDRPKSGDFSKMAFGALPFSPYEPKSWMGDLAMNMAGGGLLGAPAGVAGSVLGALTAGGGWAGGQAGGKLAGEPGAQVGSILTGLLAGGLPGQYYAGKGTLGKIVKERTAGMSEADWQRAADLQQRSNQAGVPLMASEAMNAPPMWELTSDVASTPHGGPSIGKFMGQRPGLIRDAVTGQILDPIAPSPLSTGDVASKVQGAAEGAIQRAEQARSTQTSPFYKAAATDQVPADTVRGFITQLDQMIAADPGNLNPSLRQARNALVKNEAVEEVPGTRGRYEDGKYVPATPGSPGKPLEPFTDIGTLDRARKILRDKVELPPTNAQAMEQTAGHETGGIVRDLRTAMENASTNFAQGRALHQQITNDTVAPLQRSEIGVMADRAGIPENRGITTQIRLITDPTQARPQTITKVAGELNMSDKTAFPQLARVYFENALDAATRGPRGNPDNPNVGVDFARNVHGTQLQQNNNHAILKGVAQANGIDAAGLTRGFDNLMEILDRTGRTPPIGSRTTPRAELNKQMGSGPGTDMAGLQIDKPLGWLQSRWEGWYRAGNYRKLAEVLTSPDGVMQLKRLGMMNPSTRAASVLAGQIAGFASNEGNAANGQ